MISHNPLNRFPPLAVSLILVALQLGCAGKAHLEFAALSFKTIDPPAPRVATVDMQKCFWWTDDDGELWISMEKSGTVWFDRKLRFEVQASLALEKLPAGRARNFQLGKRELRTRVKFGLWESRFDSLTGIAAVYRESGDRLRGSLRVRTSRVSSQLLGGWDKPTPYLMLGDFTAIHDEQRGRAVAQKTEANGWEREPRLPPPPPATEPSSD